MQVNKCTIKSNEGATLRLGIKNFNKDELPHELLLTTRQNTKFRNAINNNLATDIKLSKAQIKKLIQSGGFLGKLLSKLAGPLMKVALPLAKNVLAPLGLTAAMSAIDGSIQKKIHGSGIKLIIEEEDMKDIMKIIEALENSGILLKEVSKTIENETKEQRGEFLSMLLGTLGASLLGNLLTGGKGIVRAGDAVRAGEGSIASYASVVGIPAGITGAPLTLVFTIGTGISKSLLKLTKKRKKKHNKIIVLAKNKLNMIDTLLSSALNDSEISHEEFTNIINEANIYENIKENIKELTIEPSSLKRTTL